MNRRNTHSAPPITAVAFIAAGALLLAAAPQTHAAPPAAPVAAPGQAEPTPSFTPHLGVMGRAAAYGRLQVELRVQPVCAVAMPRTGDVAQIRLVCSNDNNVWLANLTPRTAGSDAFVTLNFARDPHGFAPRHPATTLPVRLLDGGLRLNLDY